MAITISRPLYDALLTASLAGDTTEVLRLRGLIDSANGVRRYYLYLRWQNVGGTRPPRIEVVNGWPVAQTYLLELERPIAREDVDAVITQRASNPADIHVTPDRDGIVGWTILADYDFTTGS